MNDPIENCELTSGVLTSPADALLGEAIAATLRLRPEERAADFEGRMREIEASWRRDQRSDRGPARFSTARMARACSAAALGTRW